MGLKRKYIKDRKFVLTLVQDGSDDAQLAEFVRSITLETKDMHPFVELADATNLRDLSNFSEKGVALAGSLEFERTPYKQDKLAILVSNNEAYNLATKYASTSGYFRYGVKIFTDFKEAISWLGVADLEDQINDMREIETTSDISTLLKTG